MSVKTPVATVGVRGTTVGGAVGTGNPELPSFFATLLQEQIREVLGAVDVFNEGSLITLSELLATAILSGDSIVFGDFSPAMQTALAQAVVSLNLSLARLIQELDPEAGPQNIPQGGDGSSDADPEENQFFTPEQLREFGESFGEAPEGLVAELLNVLIGLTEFVAPTDDPNLIDTIGEGGGEGGGEGTATIEIGDGEGLENTAGGAPGAIPLDIEVTGGNVILSGLPFGAIVTNAGGVLFVSGGPGTSSPPLTPGQVNDPDFGVIPPPFDDSDFTFQIRPANGGGPVDVMVEVEAVADLAQSEVNGQSPGVPQPGPGLLFAGPSTTTFQGSNPIAFENEGQGNFGKNDDLASAQVLGTIDPANADEALTVNGWIAEGVQDGDDLNNDVDVYKFTVGGAEASDVTIDLDYGDADETDGLESGGRIEAFDSFLSLYDANGTLVATNDNEEGLDSAITAELPPGMYFVVVSTNTNQPFGQEDGESTFDEGFGFDGPEGGPTETPQNGGDYELQIRSAEEDVAPGDRFQVSFEEDSDQIYGPPGDEFLGFGSLLDPQEQQIPSFGAELVFEAADEDGSESITRIEVQVDPEDLPPGFGIDIAGSGNFLPGGVPQGAGVQTLPMVSVLVCRLVDLGTEGEPDIQLVEEYVLADQLYDPPAGTYALTFDESLRVQKVDLSGFSWTADQDDDSDFDIEITVRSTETNPTEGSGANTSGTDRGDTDQVGHPHNYQTLVLEIDNQAVADEASISSAGIGSESQTPGSADFGFAEDNSVDMVDGQPRFLTNFDVDVSDRDGSESLTEVKLTIGEIVTGFVPIFTGEVAPGETNITPEGAIFDTLVVLMNADVLDENGILQFDQTVEVTVSLPVSGDSVLLTLNEADRVQHLDIDGFGIMFADNSGTPIPHADDDFTITVMATTTEGEGLNGAFSGEGPAARKTTTSSETFTVEVAAVADGAELSGSGSGSEGDATVPLSLGATLIDDDGSEEITEVVICVEEGFDEAGLSFTNAVQSQEDPLQWIVQPGDIDSVELVLADPDFNGEVPLTLKVTTTETDTDGLPQAGSESKTSELSFTVTIDPVNDAPVITAGTDELAPIAQDAGDDDSANPGTLVSDVVERTDADLDFGPNPPESAEEGMAITQVDETGGTWQFMPSGGAWTAIDAAMVNGGMALLLAPDTKIRFVPGEDYVEDTLFGDDLPKLTYRAWDAATGSAEAYETIPGTGGSTAFSDVERMITVDVLAAVDINMIVTVDPLEFEAAGFDVGGDGPDQQNPLSFSPYAGFVRAIGAASSDVEFAVEIGTEVNNNDGMVLGAPDFPSDKIDEFGTFFYLPPLFSSDTAPTVPETSFTYSANDGVNVDEGTVAIEARAYGDFGDELPSVGTPSAGGPSVGGQDEPSVETLVTTGSSGVDIIYANPFLAIYFFESADPADILIQRIEGLAGDDYLVGAEDFSSEGGEQSIEELLGGDGNDRLFGLTGDDRLSGGNHDDELYGDLGGPAGAGEGFGGGNGTPGMPGSDGGASGGSPFFGGFDGSDLFLGNDSLGGDDGEDELFGDSGGSLFAGDGGASGDGAPGGLGGSGSFGGKGDPGGAGGNGGDGANGGNGGDVFAGNDIIEGGAHNDWLVGDAGDDIVAGAGGNGGLAGDGGDGGDGGTVSAGGDGGDGGAGDKGGDGGFVRAGNDDMDGGGGDDWLFGGAVNDLLGGNGGNGGDGGMNGMDGFDGPEGPLGPSGGTGGNAGIGGDGGNGGSVFGGSDTLDGGAGNDSLFGDAGGNIGGGSGGIDGTDFDGVGGFDGGGSGGLGGGAFAGSDNLKGGLGDDLLVGDAGGDILAGGGVGNDLLEGGQGNDDLYGDAMGTVDGGVGGIDTFSFDLTENSGSDTIHDAEAHDVLLLENLLVDYGGNFGGPSGLDGVLAAADGWSVVGSAASVVVTLGDNNGGGTNDGSRGTIEIFGLANPQDINSFSDLEGAIGTAITP